jgi:uncharacterized protein (TIGR00369 family)
MKISIQFIFKANFFLLQCKFVEGDLGRIVVSLKVEKEHCNLYGTLHGGLSAVLVDTISTLALITDDEKSTSKLGVSVDMHMRYLEGRVVLGYISPINPISLY